MATDQDTKTTEDGKKIVVKKVAKAKVELEGAQGQKAGAGFRNKDRTLTSSALDEILSTPQGKTVATGLMTALVVALLFFFAITPALSSISRQLEKNDALRTRTAAMEEKSRNLLILQSKEVTNATALQNFDKYLNEDKHQDAIYTELLSLADKHEFTFVSVRYEIAVDIPERFIEKGLPSNVQFQTVRLSLKGDVADVPAMLKDIENQNRIYDIEEVAVTPSKDSDSAADVSFDITLLTLYWTTNFSPIT